MNYKNHEGYPDPTQGEALNGVRREELRQMRVNKDILKQYIDACELIKETEKEIRRLEKKKKTIVQTNVSGSNPDFPYEPKHFKIQGTALTYKEDGQLRAEEKLLEERKVQAEKLKLQVEQWMVRIPMRMQRIVRYKFFEGLTWQQVANRMGKRATGEGIRKEFENFMRKK